MSHLFEHCVVDGKCEIDHYPRNRSSVGGCQAAKDLQYIEAAVAACGKITGTMIFYKTACQCHLFRKCIAHLLLIVFTTL